VQSQTGQAQPGQQPDPQNPDPQQPEHREHGRNSDAWALSQQLQGKTPGKPWTQYPELVGTTANFDRLQYNFPHVAVGQNWGRKPRNVNRGGDAKGESSETRTQDDNPLSRVRDFRPPESGAVEQWQNTSGGRDGYNLTDVRTGPMAGAEIGDGSRPVTFAGAIGPARNAIDVASREAPAVGKERRALNAAPVVTQQPTARMGAWPASKTPSRLGRGINLDVGPGSPHTAAYLAGGNMPSEGGSSNNRGVGLTQPTASAPDGPPSPDRNVNYQGVWVTPQRHDELKQNLWASKQKKP